MYYIVYRTINKLNGNIYVGAHKTSVLEDGYLGSGKYLGHALKCYGEENFEREIIESFDNSEDMYLLEGEIVDEEFINRDDTYNIKLGGQGGFDFINSEVKSGRMKRNSLPGRIAANKVMSRKHQQKLQTDTDYREWWLERCRAGRENSIPSFLGKTHTKETKLKISLAKKGKCSGEDNSQFGKMWIYNEVLKTSKTILKTTNIPEGWNKGRKLKFG